MSRIRPWQRDYMHVYPYLSSHQVIIADTFVVGLAVKLKKRRVLLPIDTVDMSLQTFTLFVKVFGMVVAKRLTTLTVHNPRRRDATGQTRSIGLSRTKP